MTRCCCGVELDKKPEGIRVRISPCRCEDPGDGPRQLALDTIVVGERVYNERRRLGLPLETPLERSARKGIA